MYYAKNEIQLQSESLRRTWKTVLEAETSLKAFFSEDRDVVFVACGSSYWLSLSAHRSLALSSGKRTFVAKAGDIVLNPDEFTRAYRRPILVLPSRSGSTSEQLQALSLLRRAYGDVPALALVEYRDSELEKAADLTLLLPWANEDSVCQTRSFSNLYLALIALASLWDAPLRRGMEGYLDRRPALEQRDFDRAQQVVADFPELRHITALGSGRQYGVAVEGAYICVEMAQMVCSYYGLLEYRHGPIVTTTEGSLIAICGGKGIRGHEEKVAAEVKELGAKVLSVSGEGGLLSADWDFTLEAEDPAEAVALHFVFILQALAYALAVARDLDPDHPGDLVPFIQI